MGETAHMTRTNPAWRHFSNLTFMAASTDHFISIHPRTTSMMTAWHTFGTHSCPGTLYLQGSLLHMASCRRSSLPRPLLASTVQAVPPQIQAQAWVSTQVCGSPRWTTC